MHYIKILKCKQSVYIYFTNRNVGMITVQDSLKSTRNIRYLWQFSNLKGNTEREREREREKSCSSKALLMTTYIHVRSLATYVHESSIYRETVSFKRVARGVTYKEHLWNLTTKKVTHCVSSMASYV